MHNTFVTVLSLSVSGSALSAVILLLQRVLGSRLDQRWRCGIWLLVILRLLLPFTVGLNLIGNATQYLAPPDARPWVQTAQTEEASANLLPELPEQPATGFSPLRKGLGQAVWIIWISGVGILLVKKISGYHAFLQYVKVGCRPVEDDYMIDVYFRVCEELGVRRAPRLCENAIMNAPMLVGVLRPLIVLPEIPEQRANLRNVLVHELLHYKRGDILFKWLAQIAVCVHWFNPLVYRVARRINRTCELACDEVVIRNMNDDQKYRYGETLLSTVRPQKGYTNTIVSVTLNEDADQIEERLESIMHYQTKSKAAVAVAHLLTVVLTCCALVIGAHASVPQARAIAESGKDAVVAGSRVFSMVDRVHTVDGGYQSNDSFVLAQDAAVKITTRLTAEQGELSVGIQRMGTGNTFSHGYLIDERTKEVQEMLYYAKGSAVDETETIFLQAGEYWISVQGRGSIRSAGWDVTGVIAQGTSAPKTAASGSGLVVTYDQKRAVYDDDEALANAGYGYIESKGSFHSDYPDGRSCTVKAGQCAGALTMFTFAVERECDLTVTYRLDIAGRCKLVYVAPDGAVTVLAESSGGTLSGNRTIRLSKGNGSLRLVMDQADVAAEVIISGKDAVGQASQVRL